MSAAELHRCLRSVAGPPHHHYPADARFTAHLFAAPADAGVRPSMLRARRGDRRACSCWPRPVASASAQEASRLCARARSSSGTRRSPVATPCARGARQGPDGVGDRRRTHDGCCTWRPARTSRRRSPACASEHGVRGPCPTTSPTRPGGFIPDDPGAGRRRRADWQQLQWNFVGQFGVGAPEAWANLDRRRRARAGGRDRRRARHRASPTPTAAASAARPTSAATSSCKATTSSRQPLPERPQRPRHVRRGDDRRGHRQPLRPHRPRLRGTHHARPRARQRGRRRRLDDRRRRPLRRQPWRARDQPQPRVLAGRHRLGHPRADRSAPLRAPARASSSWRPQATRGTRAIAYPARAPIRGQRRRHDRTRLPRRATPTTAAGSRSSPPAAAPTPTSRAIPTAVPNCPPAGTSSR